MLATNKAWLSAAKQLPGHLLAAHNLQIAAAEEALAFDPAKLARDRALVEPALLPLQKRFPGMIGFASRDSTELRVNGSLLGVSFGDAELATLKPLREWIVDLDLSETAVTDASAPALSGMANLRTLRLNGTRVGDATLAALAPLSQLESIALFRTDVTDTGARVLTQLPQLRRIYASETKISPDALASLQSARREPATVDRVPPIRPK